MSIILVRCIYRLPDDQKIWSPPLQCPHCQSNFSWKSLIPLIGVFLSRKRCSSCHSSLSLQPFLIEIITIIGTSSVIFSSQGVSQMVIDLVFLYALVVISFIDWNFLIIEPRMIVLAITLRMLWLSWFELHTLLHYLVSMVIAGGAFYFIGFIYETIRKRQGLGDGDAAVIGMIALWTGWEVLSIIVLFSALSGLIIGGTLLFLKKQPVTTTQIPFAPFLCVSGSLVYFFQLAENISILANLSL